MTLSLVVLLALSQTGQPPAAVPPVPVVPVAPGSEDQAPAGPEPTPRAPPSVLTRSLLATGAGTLAGGVSLGIALLLVGTNPNFDPTFATAALASLMITGVAFAIHEAMGGRGEITLSFLLTAVVMAGAGGLAAAIGNGDRVLAPVLAAAIGSLPAAAAAVFGLEATSPKPKPKAKVSVAFGPTGFSGTF